jgi:osomolarity two-component system sensor histidine kinase NIK1
MEYKYDLTVLYVEDARVAREFTNKYFQELFSNVIVAVNGKDGVDKYIQNHNKPKSIDLVITDITMPEMNGFEMVEELRKVNQDLHVIMLSALEFGSLMKDFNQINSLNKFIEKPLKRKPFLEILEKTLQNIDERNRYKKQYSLSIQYHNALDYSAIVTKTDKNGIITFANDAFCQISGYKSDELIGKSHNIVRDPNVPKEFFKDMWQTIKAKMIYKHPSIPNRAKNGDIYYVDTTILPILDQNRNIQEYISIRFDTTQLEHQIRDEKKALQSQEKFLANMSHEIRTPLNGILGFAKILQEQITDPELKEYADIIKQSGKNLLGIINQILDLSKIQSGHMELDKSWFNLYSDITSIKKLFEINAKEKQIEFSCILCSTTSDNLLQKIEVFSDSLKLKQVISNLINNAIKFTPNGGKILFDVRRVSYDEKTIKLRFSVKDNGIGIAKDKQENIFEPFKQADLSTTREYGGTGLGLALAKDFVKFLDSELKVESDLDKGSEFYFEAEFEYKRLKGDTKNTECGYILLAEDVQIYQKLTEILLQDLDAKILLAENGYEALKIFQKDWQKIDAVLLDIKMPIMDGIEACKKINHFKEINNIKSIPIIALTGDDSLKNDEKYLEIGFDIVISKPIDEIIFKDTIRNLPKRKNTNLNISTNENGFSGLNGESTIVDQEKDYANKTNDSIDLDSKSNGTVLVAEDVVINQKLIGIILKKFGLNVVFTNNGLEAVNYFTKEHKNIDVVLLDINMPFMDGIEALEIITAFKKSNHITNTPIIALTANVISSDKEKYLKLGFDGYLAKPIDNDKLFDILNKYLHLDEKNKTEQNTISEETVVKINLEQNAQKLSLPFEFYKELLGDFCKLLEKEIPRLELAINGNDSLTIQDVAHKLKGVAGNLAIELLFENFKSIEEQLDAKNYDEIKRIYQEIKTTIKGHVCF